MDNARVRKGSKITLSNSEDPKRKWEVIFVSEALDTASIHLEWEVGGLSSRQR